MSAAPTGPRIAAMATNRIVVNLGPDEQFGSAPRAVVAAWIRTP